MTGLLPYLKSLYGDSDESDFSPGTVSMQSKQRWDKEKGGVIGEDDEFISSTSAEDSWWDEDITPTDGGATKRVTIDAKNVVSRDVLDEDDNNTLPSLHTKADNVEEDDGTALNDMLNAPPPTRRTIVNDESTISSNLTMDTIMETVDSNISNLDNSVNHMAHMLTLFMKEMTKSNGLSDGSNSAPATFLNKANAAAVSKHTARTTVTEDKPLSDQFQ